VKLNYKLIAAAEAYGKSPMDTQAQEEVKGRLGCIVNGTQAEIDGLQVEQYPEGILYF
jgi:hypothetical protein